MIKNHLIKKVVTALLLVVFAISATPKLFLHDAFANHKDSKAAASSDTFHHKKIAKSTIHCQLDDLVVEAPYISYNNNIKVFAPFVFITQFSETFNSFRSSVPVSFGLRGPPSLV
ncbi:MAG: hypothetical protein ACRDE8_06120 [Ginsengibacter sp.]